MSDDMVILRREVARLRHRATMSRAASSAYHGETNAVTALHRGAIAAYDNILDAIDAMTSTNVLPEDHPQHAAGKP